MANSESEAILRTAIDEAYAPRSEEHVEASEALEQMVTSAKGLLFCVGDLDRAATLYRGGLLAIRDYFHNNPDNLDLDTILDIARRGVMNGSAVLPRMGPHYQISGCSVTPDDARYLVAALITDGAPDAMSAAKSIGSRLDINRLWLTFEIEPAERDAILSVLDDPPDGLVELRDALKRDREKL